MQVNICKKPTDKFDECGMRYNDEIILLSKVINCKHNLFIVMVICNLNQGIFLKVKMIDNKKKDNFNTEYKQNLIRMHKLILLLNQP